MDLYKQKPYNLKNTNYSSIQDKERKIKFIIFALQNINNWFGDLSNFTKALQLLKDAPQKNPDKYGHLTIPDEVNTWLLTEDDTINELKKEARRVAPLLIALGRYSRQQYELLHHKFKFFPCYRTTRRDWNSQDDITKCEDNDFFTGLENGIRAICKRSIYSEVPHITILNMFRWILFLIYIYYEDELTFDYDINIYLGAALWADGAKTFGGIKGLYNALKIISIECDEINCTVHNIKWLLSTCWLTGISTLGETTKGVHDLEHMQMRQISELPKTIKYKNIVLHPYIRGWCTDHGYRIKGLRKDDHLHACGECSWSKIASFAGNIHQFLDMSYLMTLMEVTFKNWFLIRDKGVPQYMALVYENEITLISYDNHHNMVGLIKKLYHTICFKVKCNKEKLLIIKERMYAYTQIEDDDFLKNCKNNYRRKFPYPGWKWRLASLSFKDIFASIFPEDAEKELFKLLQLLNEIHLFNYTHFNRKADNFNELIVRYWMLISSFATQLKIVFNNAEEANLLNDLYTHKVLVHSPRIFMFYNLACFSCETGEGVVSVTNRTNRTGVFRNQYLSIIKMVEYNLLNQEERVIQGRTEPPSRIWIEELQITTLVIHPDDNSTFTRNALLNPDNSFSYLKEFKAPKIKIFRRSGVARYKFTTDAFKNQKECLPDKVTFTDSNSLEIKPATEVRISFNVVVEENVDVINRKLNKLKAILKKHYKHHSDAKKEVSNLTTKINEREYVRWKLLSETLPTIKNELSNFKEKLENNILPVVDVDTVISDNIDTILSNKPTITGDERKREANKKIKQLDILEFLDNQSTVIKLITSTEVNCVEFLSCIPGDYFTKEQKTTIFFGTFTQFIANLKHAQSSTESIIKDIKREVPKQGRYEGLIEQKKKEIESLKISQTTNSNHVSEEPEVPLNGIEPNQITEVRTNTTKTKTTGKRKRKDFSASLLYDVSSQKEKRKHKKRKLKNSKV